MSINYAPLYDFATSYCVDYNHLCAVVREALSAPLPQEAPSPMTKARQIGAVIDGIRDAQEAPADERARFEAAVRAQYPRPDSRLTLRRDMPGSERFGEYVFAHIEFAWKLWQARAALSTPPAAPEHRMRQALLALHDAVRRYIDDQYDNADLEAAAKDARDAINTDALSKAAPERPTVKESLTDEREAEQASVDEFIPWPLAQLMPFGSQQKVVFAPEQVRQAIRAALAATPPVQREALAALSELPFIIEPRGGTPVIDWSARGGQGCRPATEAEALLWAVLAAAPPADEVPGGSNEMAEG
jgi:hypothetical protein